MNARSPSDTKGTNLRTRLREATATAILEAAEGLFADKGLRSTSMNDIAAAAGVAVGTLYNHFADKETLIHDLFEVRRDGMLDVIDDALKAHAPDFRSQLLRLVTGTFGYFKTHARFYTILWTEEASVHSGASKQAMMPILYDRFDKLMKRGIKERALKAEHAEFYPAMLMGLMRATGICASVTKGKNIPDPDKIVELFLNGAAA